MPDDLPTTSTGKIARLPVRIREDVCRRLRDGQSEGQILPWLNALPEVQAILKAQYEGVAISPQNLSAWRGGGFQKWLKQQENIESTKERARFSLELAKASGGNLSEGALAQLTGEIMEMVEEVSALRKAGGEINPKALAVINKSLVAARAKELDTLNHNLNLKRLDQKDRELAISEAKFEIEACNKFLEWAEDKRARAITESSERKDVKMEQLRLLLFGRKPEKKEGE